IIRVINMAEDTGQRYDDASKTIRHIALQVEIVDHVAQFSLKSLDRNTQRRHDVEQFKDFGDLGDNQKALTAGSSDVHVVCHGTGLDRAVDQPVRYPWTRK